MAIKKLNPITPGMRFKTSSTFEELTRSQPEKPLIRSLKKKGGRNNRGRMTIRHRGGGHKRRYRIIDFKRDKFGIPAKVASIEYDPNRSARIALLNYVDGEKRYIIAPLGLKVGERVNSGPEAEIRVGNFLPLMRVPLGTIVHNVELKPGKGGELVRGAGSGARVVAKEGRWVQLKLPSGEVRNFPSKCGATIGTVGNPDHEKVSFGAAGKSRWLGRRPKVRGVAMNPVDHPMGGGEGKSSGGRHPSTPWGVATKGYKTRKRKASDKLIVRRRG